MELDRVYMTLNHSRGRAENQITLEEDLNVPDQKPDIFRVIHRQGEFRPDEVKGEAGKVKVRGIFSYRILYIGEGSERRPEYLEGSIPVDELLFLNGLEDGEPVDFWWEIEDLHASAIHSRKASIKCVLALSAEAREEEPAPFVSAGEPDGDLLVRSCPVQIKKEVIHRKENLRIREELNLPPGKPNIRRILWRECRLQETEARQEEGRFLVKGELAVFFLYESEAEDAGLQWVEQEIPFRQEVECGQCSTELFGSARAWLAGAELEVQADYDGEARMVRLDAAVGLSFRYFEELQKEVLCDAYSLSKEIGLKKRRCVWDDVCGISDSRARVNGRMKLSDTEPGMLQILCAGAQAHLDHTQRNEQGLLMQGSVELWVLYAASDDAQPVACAMQTFPFEHTAEAGDAAEDCVWQCFACVDQLLVTMLDAQELEMKAVVKLQALFTAPRELTLVEELTEEPLDMDRIRQMPGMVIHVVQPGETLWDIAKAHATTCRDVMELNDRKEEDVQPGEKLLTVKTIAHGR